MIINDSLCESLALCLVKESRGETEEPKMSYIDGSDATLGAPAAANPYRRREEEDDQDENEEDENKKWKEKKKQPPTLNFLSVLGVSLYIITEPLMSHSLSVSPWSSRKGQLMDGISFSMRATAPISCMPKDTRMPPW